MNVRVRLQKEVDVILCSGRLDSGLIAGKQRRQVVQTTLEEESRGGRRVVVRGDCDAAVRIDPKRTGNRFPEHRGSIRPDAKR